ncbi:hypothetical protein LshimejAT787_0411130 [Lyophyllum shimeji]|uniref:Uncharacterized protein n=1 Tax=Lyophyllum shimeji TaxID=47721 RepID=A0A9P3PKP7_LYOSH|nr:hypothetical protein LshimejAT787_0411130 [Lyophyllum shimeji]
MVWASKETCYHRSVMIPSGFRSIFTSEPETLHLVAGMILKRLNEGRQSIEHFRPMPGWFPFRTPVVDLYDRQCCPSLNITDK